MKRKLLASLLSAAMMFSHTGIFVAAEDETAQPDTAEEAVKENETESDEIVQESEAESDVTEEKADEEEEAEPIEEEIAYDEKEYEFAAEIITLASSLHDREYITYTITINPEERMLNDISYNESITVVDYLPYDVELDLNSVTVKDGSGDDIENAMIYYSGEDRQPVTFIIPDEMMAVITLTVHAQKYGEQTFSNDAVLRADEPGQSSLEDHFNIIEAGSISLQKIDMFNLENTLEGAVFELYRSEYDSDTGIISGNETLICKGVTDSEGILKLTDLEPYKLYYWIETEAPEAYMVTDSERHYFIIYMLGETDDETAANREHAQEIDNMISEANGITVASVEDQANWTVENKKIMPAELTISGEKKMTDGKMEDGKFTFTIEAVSGTAIDDYGNETTLNTDEIPMPEITNTKNTQTNSDKTEGIFEFSPITYATRGTYVYKVTEEAGTDLYTYDSSEYIVTVTVRRNDEGDLTASASFTKDGDAAETILFENGVGNLSLRLTCNMFVNRKSAAGRTTIDGAYQFQILGPDNRPFNGELEDGTPITNGMVEFVITNGESKSVTLVNLEPGTYKVRELLSGDKIRLINMGGKPYVYVQEYDDYFYTAEVGAGESETPEISFNLNRTVGSLKMKKTINIDKLNPRSSSVANRTVADGDYTFTIKGPYGASSQDQVTITVVTTVEDGEMVSATVNGIPGELDGSGYVEIKDLEEGNYLIQETLPDNGTYCYELVGGERDSSVPGYVRSTSSRRMMATVLGEHEGDTVYYDFENTFSYTNNISTGSLKVSNAIFSTTASDKERSFDFTVTLDTELSGEFGEMTFVDGVATFSLSNYESKTAKGIPDGIGYTVTETPVAGFVTTVSGSASGTISGGSTRQVSFDNERAEGSLVVSNEINSIVDTDKTFKTFKFTVKLMNDDDSPADINGKYGDCTFTSGTASFYLGNGESSRITSIPAGLKYIVENAVDPSFDTVSENESGIISDSEITAAFVYIRKSGDLKISKTVVSAAAADHDVLFEFTITMFESFSGTFDDVKFTNGTGVIQLKDGESKTITGLPQGITYRITETENSDFQQTKKENWYGTLSDTLTEASFENTKNTGDLRIYNTVESDLEEDLSKEFHYTVTLSDKTISGTFGDISFFDGIAEIVVKGRGNQTAVGLPMGIEYAVTQRAEPGFKTTVDGNETDTAYGGIIKLANIVDFVNTRTSSGTVPEFKGHQLVLSGTLGLKFGLVLPENFDASGSYVTFTGNNIEQTIDIDDAEDKDGKKIFTCYLNTLQMAEQIEAVFHYGDNQTVDQTYSLAEYFSYFDEHESDYNEKTLYLVHAVADYGYFAQPYLISLHNLGDKYAAITKHYAELFDYDTIKPAVAQYTFAKGISDSEVTAASYKLSLDEDTALSVMVKVPAGTAVNATATFNGKTYEMTKDSSTVWSVKIPGIKASQLGDTITVSGTAGGNFTISVSALSYVRSVLNSEKYGDDAKNAVSALYQYYTAVKAY